MGWAGRANDLVGPGPETTKAAQGCAGRLAPLWIGIKFEVGFSRIWSDSLGFSRIYFD